MGGEFFSRPALLICVLLSSKFSFNDANNLITPSKGVESLLEYHFHTYFDEHDPVQVAQAIQLRNEIIANCASKKIIAVPLHYHFDPENPKFERKTFVVHHILRKPYVKALHISVIDLHTALNFF